MNGRSLAAVLAGALAAACVHGEPFSYHATEGDPNPPRFNGAGLQQLTLNPRGDFAPAWLPDQSGISFSWYIGLRNDNDRCLAIFRTALNRIGQTICLGGRGQRDSTHLVLSSATSPGGRLAFIGEQGRIGVQTSLRALFIGRLDEPAVAVLDMPFTAPGGLVHQSMEQMVWLDETTLLYVATAARATTSSDLESAPLEIGRLTIGPDNVVTPAVVPNTRGASSVGVDSTTGLVYATFVQDSVAYLIDVVTGQRQVAYDFSGIGLPRDVRVQAGKLVAVVGGRVEDLPASQHGIPTHVDDGGDLVVVQLGTGTTPLVLKTDRLWFHRLALASDGRRLVAEGFPVEFVLTCLDPCIPLTYDTLLTKVSDLWLITIP